MQPETSECLSTETESARGAAVQTRDELIAFVQRRVEDHDTASDIVHDVLARFLAADADTIRNPQAWLYRAARNAIVDHYRTRRHHEPLPAELDLGLDAEDSGPNSATRELAGCLRPLIAHLPETYRRALTLVDLEGRTHLVAAEAEAVSVSGMKSRVQRGRRQLGRLLAQCCSVETTAGGQISDYEPAGECGC
jgi:RNA polymerase sigma-70 factor (ECF subfamily)